MKKSLKYLVLAALLTSCACSVITDEKKEVPVVQPAAGKSPVTASPTK